jgi:hypothetical protein
MGEVVPAPTVEEPKTKAAPEVAGKTTAATTPTAPLTATAATVPTAPIVPEPKPKEATILTFPAPLKEGEGEGEEPRGLWGGFWRRRTDD